MKELDIKKLKNQARNFHKIYSGFFDQFYNKYSEMVKNYGKDDVCEFAQRCGCIRRNGFNYNKNTRMILVPAELKKAQDSQVFLEFSTDPKSDRFKVPLLLKKQEGKLVGLPIESVKPIEKLMFSDAIMNTLDCVEREIEEYHERHVFGSLFFL